MLRRFALAALTLTALFGAVGVAAAGPAPAVVAVDSAHPAQTGATALNGNYIFNNSNIAVGVSCSSADPPSCYRLLGSGQNTRTQFGWAVAVAVYSGGGYCIRIDYNNGELGWHFFHFYHPDVPTYLVFGSSSNWRVTAYPGACQ